MLNKVLSSCDYVVENAKHVKINYDKLDDFIKNTPVINIQHYFTKIPYPIIEMDIKDIVDFLLIYDSINYSFWGDPKWTIKTENGNLDGSIALLHCILNLFKNKNSEDVFKYLEEMTGDEFRNILTGNVEIPLFEQRYQTVVNITKTVNSEMNGSFYSYIKDVTNDSELFKIIIDNFPSFDDTRIYNGQKIYFYKLAQLLTSDILHMIELKEKVEVSYFNLTGCADYKIPQVLRSLGILEYSSDLETTIDNKQLIKENDEIEVEIRASMLVVVNYMYEKMNKRYSRIDLNDYIWKKSQDKSLIFKPYHLTRTSNY